LIQNNILNILNKYITLDATEEPIIDIVIYHFCIIRIQYINNDLN